MGTATRSVSLLFDRSQRALSLVGAVYIGCVAFKAGRFVFRHYLKPYNSKNLINRYGEGWAIVTGASQGIGRSFCHQLAAQGFSIVLIARTETDLKAVAQELERKYHVNTKVFPMDGADPNVEHKVDQMLKETPDVKMLVNNVATINDRPKLLHEMENSEAQRIINVNCGFTVLLTSQTIKRKEVSCIINIGSLTSSIPFAMQTVYAATKAFISHFSRCLAAEYPNIDVLCARPGLTATKMISDKNGLVIAHPDDVAKDSLKFIGCSEILPIPAHAALDWASTIVPQSWQAMATLSMGQELQKGWDEKNK